MGIACRKPGHNITSIGVCTYICMCAYVCVPIYSCIFVYILQVENEHYSLCSLLNLISSTTATILHNSAQKLVQS